MHACTHLHMPPCIIRLCIVCVHVYMHTFMYLQVKCTNIMYYLRVLTYTLMHWTLVGSVHAIHSACRSRHGASPSEGRLADWGRARSVHFTARVHSLGHWLLSCVLTVTGVCYLLHRFPYLHSSLPPLSPSFVSSLSGPFVSFSYSTPPFRTDHVDS